MSEQLGEQEHNLDIQPQVEQNKVEMSNSKSNDAVTQENNVLNSQNKLQSQQEDDEKNFNNPLDTKQNIDIDKLESQANLEDEDKLKYKESLPQNKINQESQNQQITLLESQNTNNTQETNQFKMAIKKDQKTLDNSFSEKQDNQIVKKKLFQKNKQNTQNNQLLAQDNIINFKNPQSNNNKKNSQIKNSTVIQYEVIKKNGITYEIEKPTSLQIQKEFVIKFAPNEIIKKQKQSFELFKDRILKKAKKITGLDFAEPLSNQSNVYVTTIKPQKRPKQVPPLDQSQSSEKQKQSKQQERRIIKSLAPPKQSNKNLVQNNALNSNKDGTKDIIKSSEKKKRELQKKLEEIRQEILNIEEQERQVQMLAIKKNKSSVVIKGSPAKLNVLTKNEQQTSISQELDIKKHNQVAVMIRISDNKNKLQEALSLVRKLNQERKEREKKIEAKFFIDVQRKPNGDNQFIVKVKNHTKIDQRNPFEQQQSFQQKMINEIQQITNDQKELSNQLQGERQMKIMERITLREKAKYDLLMRQERTKKFLKEIKKNPTENGDISKKFMHELVDLDLNREENQKLFDAQIPGSIIIEKDYSSAVMSRVIADDKKKKIEEKIKNFQKQEMYKKRQAYGEHVNRNFLPKIQRSLNRDDLLEQYRQLADEYQTNEYQPNQRDIEIQKYQLAQQGNNALIEETENYEYKVKRLSKKRAWQVNYELFEKPIADKYEIKQ